MKKLPLIALMLVMSRWSSADSQEQHFFPVRPSHVTIHRVYGILTAFAIGNDTGGFSVKKTDGAHDEFFLASPLQIDGKPFNPYGCGHPTCLPPGIKLGRSHVAITYWLQKAPWGSLVKVSDSFQRAR